jgi:hypothetical protein
MWSQGGNLMWLFRGETYRRWLGLDKVIRVQSPWLNPGGFIRGRDLKIHITHIPCLLSCDVLHCLGTLLARPLPDVAFQLCIFRNINQNRPPFFITYPVYGIVQLVAERRQTDVKINTCRSNITLNNRFLSTAPQTLCGIPALLLFTLLLFSTRKRLKTQMNICHQVQWGSKEIPKREGTFTWPM